jgi:hypothetical protein
MPDTPATIEAVHYLPIGTTVLAAIFLAVLLARAGRRGWPPHLIWWAVGVFFYGVGTALESAVTLGGNSIGLTKAWYIAGAILGGYPLATGSVYLLCTRRLAHALTAITLVVVLVVSVLVLLSPVDASKLEPHRPSGAILGWQWVRLMTPIINLYAAAFLIGGALYSCANFLLSGTSPWRAAGTALIAVGAILPGIGGAQAKRGLVEWLYVGEFAGLILIWAGYTLCLKGPAPARPASEAPDLNGASAPSGATAAYAAAPGRTVEQTD